MLGCGYAHCKVRIEIPILDKVLSGSKSFYTVIQEENTQCPNSSHSTTVVCSYRSSLATTRPGVLYTQVGACMHHVNRAHNIQ